MLVLAELTVMPHAQHDSVILPLQLERASSAETGGEVGSLFAAVSQSVIQSHSSHVSDMQSVGTLASPSLTPEPGRAEMLRARSSPAPPVSLPSRARCVLHTRAVHAGCARACFCIAFLSCVLDTIQAHPILSNPDVLILARVIFNR